jgi:hypothetical protein
MRKVYLIPILFLFSCFDIIHYLELKEKKFHSEYRIRLSKTLFSMAGTQGANPTEINLEEILKKLETLFPNGKFTGDKKETEQSLTFHFKYDGEEVSIQKRKVNDVFPVVPYKDENGQYVILFYNKQNQMNQNQGGMDANMMAEAILSGPLYRVILGGDLKPSSANLVQVNNKSSIEILKFGNQFMIEVPVSQILKGSSALVISFNEIEKLNQVQKFITELNPEKKIDSNSL